MWALSQMAFARPSLSRKKNLSFWKLLGSGIGEGFTPIPNTAVYAILCVWPSEEIARQEIETAAVFAKYQQKSVEDWTVFLVPTAVRGAWNQQVPFEAHKRLSTGPLAALTRATLKPTILWKFWKRVPAISDVIGNDPKVVFKIGVGEIPWFHQMTFSIWPDEKAMADFARTSGPHAKAIKAVRTENWFREELYARFQIVGHHGRWMGNDPLEHLNLEPAS